MYGRLLQNISASLTFHLFLFSLSIFLISTIVWVYRRMIGIYSFSCLDCTSEHRTPEILRTNSDTSCSVGILWSSDRLIRETSFWQHTTLTTEKNPWSRWDSKLQSQKASGRRPRSQWHRLMEILWKNCNECKNKATLC